MVKQNQHDVLPIKIVTNYNVLLFHFIDYLSCWDYFVGRHIEEWYTNEFSKTTDDERQLVEYRRIRKKLGWQGESSLFDWAYRRFTGTGKHHGIVDILRYFENRKSINGIALKQILIKRLGQINQLTFAIMNKLNNQITFEVIEKMAILFNRSPELPIVRAYLAASMGKSYQGGANGDNIFSEIPVVPKQKAIEGTTECILHEYLHKALLPKNFLSNQTSLELRTFYKNKVESIYPNELSSFFEEVIVHYLSAVYINHEKVGGIISYYQDRKPNTKINSLRKQRSLFLWKGVKQIAPIMKKYINNQNDVESTIKEINNFCFDFVNKCTTSQ